MLLPDLGNKYYFFFLENPAGDLEAGQVGESELHLVLVEEVLGHGALHRLPVIQLGAGLEINTSILLKSQVRIK